MSANARPRLGALGLVGVAVVVLSSARTAVSVAGPTPISSAELLSRIEAATTSASRGLTAPSTAAMDEVRSALSLPVAVRFGDRVVSIQPDPFLARLGGSTPDDFTRAMEHLDALAASTRRAAAAPTISATRVRDALAEAYRDVPTESIVTRYMTYAFRLVGNLLTRWIESLDVSHGLGSVVAWSVLFLLLAAVVAILRRLGVGFVPEPATPGGRPGAPVDWRAAAERAIARGDTAMAVVALYHLLLERLAARGVITADPAVTAGECRTAVARSLPGAYRHVASATEAFERVAYGGRAAEARDLEALRDANGAVGRR